MRNSLIAATILTVSMAISPVYADVYMSVGAYTQTQGDDIYQAIGSSSESGDNQYAENFSDGAVIIGQVGFSFDIADDLSVNVEHMQLKSFGSIDSGLGFTGVNARFTF